MLPFLADEPPVLCDWLPWNHTFGGNHNFGIDALQRRHALHRRRRADARPGSTTTVGQPARDRAHRVLQRAAGLRDAAAGAARRRRPPRSASSAGCRSCSTPPPACARRSRTSIDALAVEACGERVPWVTGLGATETAPFALCTGRDADAGSGRVGVPAPGVELKLVPVGAELEARVRGPNVTPGYWRDRRSRARRSTTRASTGWATRSAASIRPIPRAGFVFDGRLAEDFKLSTGTWVRVGPLRARAARGARRAACRTSSSPATSATTCARWCSRTSPRAGALAALAAGGAGRRRARGDAVLRARSRPRCRPSRGAAPAARRASRARCCSASRRRSTRGEITDKGSLNQKAVLRRRAAFVDALYGAGPPMRFIDVDGKDDRRVTTRPSTIQAATRSPSTCTCTSRRPADGSAADLAARKYFGDSGAARDAHGLAEYYRSRRMACVVFSVDERLTGRPQLSNDAVARLRRRERRRRDRLRQHRSARAAPTAVARSPAPGRGRPRPRAQAASAAAAVRAERSPRLSALRGVRRGEAAGALPHRAQRHRHRHAGRRRHPPEVRQSDADRRRRGGLSGDADHPGAPVVPLAGRGDLDLPAQADGLHRPLGLVAEVLLADARAVREHAAQAQGAVRLGLSAASRRTAGWRISRRSRFATRCGR